MERSLTAAAGGDALAEITPAKARATAAAAVRVRKDGVMVDGWRWVGRNDCLACMRPMGFHLRGGDRMSARESPKKTSKVEMAMPCRGWSFARKAATQGVFVPEASPASLAGNAWQLHAP